MKNYAAFSQISKPEAIYLTFSVSASFAITASSLLYSILRLTVNKYIRAILITTQLINFLVLSNALLVMVIFFTHGFSFSENSCELLSWAYLLMLPNWTLPSIVAIVRYNFTKLATKGKIVTPQRALIPFLIWLLTYACGPVVYHRFKGLNIFTLTSFCMLEKNEGGPFDVIQIGHLGIMASCIIYGLICDISLHRLVVKRTLALVRSLSNFQFYLRGHSKINNFLILRGVIYTCKKEIYTC